MRDSNNMEQHPYGVLYAYYTMQSADGFQYTAYRCFTSTRYSCARRPAHCPAWFARNIIFIALLDKEWWKGATDCRMSFFLILLVFATSETTKYDANG